MSIAWNARDLSPTYRLALIYLAENVGDERGNGFVRRQGLEEFVGPHIRGQAEQIVDDLEAAGFLVRDPDSQVDWIGDLDGAEILFRIVDPREAAA